MLDSFAAGMLREESAASCNQLVWVGERVLPLAAGLIREGSAAFCNWGIWGRCEAENVFQLVLVT